jgi:hypothetical protein
MQGTPHEGEGSFITFDLLVLAGLVQQRHDTRHNDLKNMTLTACAECFHTDLHLC